MPPKQPARGGRAPKKGVARSKTPAALNAQDNHPVEEHLEAIEVPKTRKAAPKKSMKEDSGSEAEDGPPPPPPSQPSSKRKGPAHKDEPPVKKTRTATKATGVTAATAKSHVTRLLDVVESEARAFAQDFEATSQKLDSAKEEVKKLKKMLSEITADKKEAVKELQDLNERFKTLSKQKDDLEEIHVNVTNEFFRNLDKKRDEENYYDEKVSDDEIRRLWFKIVYEINQLVSQVLCNNPSSEDPSVRAILCQPALGLYEEANKIPRLRPYLVQQFIWNRLYNDVFLGGRMLWCGQQGTKLMEFIQTLPDAGLEHAEELSVLKGRAAKHLNKVLGKNEVLDENKANQKTSMIEEMERDISVFCDNSMKEQFTPRMTAIVDTALDLQRIFNTSRAFFVPTLIPEATTQVDEEQMDVRFRLSNSMEGEFFLGVAISPMIVKIGNAEGRYFNSRYTICKALVTVQRQISEQASPERSEPKELGHSEDSNSHPVANSEGESNDTPQEEEQEVASTEMSEDSVALVSNGQQPKKKPQQRGASPKEPIEVSNSDSELSAEPSDLESSTSG